MNILAESGTCRCLDRVLESTPMAVPKLIRDAKGLWNGKSLLNLPFLPQDKQVSESQSTLHIDTDGHDAFATIAYTWAYEGKRQEGTILLCASEHGNTVQLGWVDSWHQNTSVMHLNGEVAKSGLLKAKGTYVAGKEAWGWTIAFRREEDGLNLEMENVKPTGEAVWAVRTVYGRE